MNGLNLLCVIRTDVLFFFNVKKYNVLILAVTVR